jgi:hypothetical protein
VSGKKNQILHEGKLYYSMGHTAATLGTTVPKLKRTMIETGLDWANFRDNGPIWISAQSIVDYLKRSEQKKFLDVSAWSPTPGKMATYVGRTKAQTRNVIVIAEAVAGRMIVEAIGRKGANVRLTVKRESLREPQPDLFG